MGVAIEHSNIGAANTELGLHEEAVHWLTSSIDLAREHGLRYHEGNALANLADVDERQGHMAAALRHAEQALEVTRETRNRRDEAMALVTLGNMCEHDGDFERAVSSWTDALAIMDEISEPRNPETVRHLEQLKRAE
jgi:tetratricopeptide (TPR) repeat protein